MRQASASVAQRRTASTVNTAWSLHLANIFWHTSQAWRKRNGFSVEDMGLREHWDILQNYGCGMAECQQDGGGESKRKLIRLFEPQHHMDHKCCHKAMSKYPHTRLDGKNPRNNWVRPRSLSCQKLSLHKSRIDAIFIKAGIIRNRHPLYNPKPYDLVLHNISDHTGMESRFDVFGGGWD